MGSYKDVLARSERKRPDGRSVWPLTDADLPSRFRALPVTRVEREVGR